MRNEELDHVDLLVWVVGRLLMELLHVIVDLLRLVSQVLSHVLLLLFGQVAVTVFVVLGKVGLDLSVSVTTVLQSITDA